MSYVAGASGGGGDTAGNKTRWPEDAAKVIKRDMPGATIEVLSSDEPTSMDIVPDRVRLFVDTIAMAPTAELEPAGGKSSWPEVLGMSAEEAQEVILNQRPGADIEVVPVGRPVAGDLKANHVRIFVDTVADTPFMG